MAFPRNIRAKKSLPNRFGGADTGGGGGGGGVERFQYGGYEYGGGTSERLRHKQSHSSR